MESEVISDNPSSICIHCCGPIRHPSSSKDDDKFQHSSPSLANSTYDVPKALSSIFRLNYLKPFDTLEWLQRDEEDGQLTLLCINCKGVLADLYHLYQDFVQLGQIDSVLSQKLHQLDEIIDCHERKSINCDLIAVSRPEVPQDGKETRDKNTILHPPASSSSARSQRSKGLNILLTRLPENEFTSTATTSTTAHELNEKEFGGSSSDHETHDDDCNPQDWLQVKMEDDDESESAEIKIIDLQDIVECDDDDDKPLMTYSRRGRRKQDLNSSSVNQSSSSSIRNNPMTQYRAFLPKNNMGSIESTRIVDEEDAVAAVGDNRKKLRKQKLAPKKSLSTSTSSSAGDKHKCPLCQIYAPTTSDLVNHLYVTHAPKGSTCPVCKRVLSRREYLKDHLCTHARHKPFNCPNCTLSFLKRSDLKRHFGRIHEGETLDEESLKGQSRNRIEVIDLTPHTSCDSSLILHNLCEMNPTTTTTTTIDDDHPVTPVSVDTEEDDDHKIKFQTLHCSKCSKKFLYHKNLQAHRKICHMKKTTTTKNKKKRKGIDEEGEDTPELLKCSLCTTEFSNKFELSDHIWASHVVPTSQEGMKTDCPLCAKKYPTDPSKLKAHILFTHATAAEGEHECPTCGKKFYRACNLSRHIPTHQKIPKSYECKDCGKSFPTMYRLNLHVVRHTKDYQFPCPVSGCGEAFVDRTTMKLHQFKAHPEEGQSMPHICRFCGKGFVFHHMMKAHEVIHMDRPFSCSQCNRRFVSESELLIHQQKGCKGKTRFQCHLCVKSYAHITNLQSHLRFHAGDTIVCTVEGCGRKFYDKNILASHVRDHDKTFKCPDPSCGRYVRTSSNLTLHLQAMHPHLISGKGGAPQLCPVCGESVLGNGRLKRHMRTHSNERPHKCHLCESAFKTASALNQHLRIHAKDKSHPCTFEGCSKSFYTTQKLENHRKVHTGEKDFLCPECGKSFALQENLKKHALIHSDERRFQCQFCDKAFKQPQSLKTHQTTHHAK